MIKAVDIFIYEKFGIFLKYILPSAFIYQLWLFNHFLIRKSIIIINHSIITTCS